MLSRSSLALTFLLAISTANGNTQDNKCVESCIKSTNKCKDVTSEECKKNFNFFIQCSKSCSTSVYKEWHWSFGDKDSFFGFPTDFFKNLDKKFKEYAKTMKEDVLKTQENAKEKKEKHDKEASGNKENDFQKIKENPWANHNFLDGFHSFLPPVVLPTGLTSLFFRHFLTKRAALMPYPYDMAQEYVLLNRLPKTSCCNSGKGKSAGSV